MASGRLILAAGLLMTVLGCSEPSGNGPLMTEVTIDGHRFDLELVTDEVSRNRGLMGRESIPEHGGMLFVFPDAQVRSFWMGHCLVDIDLIFLDSRGRVTATHRMQVASAQRPDESEWAYRARLPSYWSGYPAQFAIELRAGWLDRLDLHVDDRIEMDLDRLKALVE
jgi:uncharacterized membrane protein (UPF0127 family)